MDSAINMHLAVTKLQDSLQVAESARAGRAVQRAPRRPRLTWLATAWHGNRRAAEAAVSPRARSPLGA